MAIRPWSLVFFIIHGFLIEVEYFQRTNKHRQQRTYCVCGSISSFLAWLFWRIVEDNSRIWLKCSSSILGYVCRLTIFYLKTETNYHPSNMLNNGHSFRPSPTLLPSQNYWHSVRHAVGWGSSYFLLLNCGFETNK